MAVSIRIQKLEMEACERIAAASNHPDRAFKWILALDGADEASTDFRDTGRFPR